MRLTSPENRKANVEGSADANTVSLAAPGSQFGNRVRYLRQQNGISQRALAEKLGVSPAYLSLLESGKKGRPSDRIIHAICHQFGLIWDDADALFVMADNSRRIIKVDASQLDNRKTEAAKLFADKLPKLTEEQVQQLFTILQG